jgi:hypothetical protein
MEHQKRDSVVPLMTTHSAGDRRRTLRQSGQLGLTFSGMDATHIVMDTGTVFDLCRDGIGLHTERSLKLGMELALFIECPDSEEDICIPEARVEWVKENRVGLSIRTIKAVDRDRLQRCFSSSSLQLPVYRD